MSSTTDGEIVKEDTRGRIWTKPERRAELLTEFARSGMTGQQFAQWAGIKYTTFASWRAKQRREGGAVSPASRTTEPVQWVEAMVAEPASSPSKPRGLLIELGNGCRLSVADAAQARLAGVVLREVLHGAKAC